MAENSMSRREFLKIAGIAGVSIGMAGGLGGVLAACGDDETTSTTAAGATTTGATTGTTAQASSTTVSQGGGAAKTLTIGGVTFLTGPAAAGGLAGKTGWELACHKINDDGGLKIGGDTYNLKMIVEDDAMSLDQAVTAAQKLIQQDGAKFIVGPMVSAFINTVSSICNNAGVLHCETNSTNTSAVIKYDNQPDVSPDKPLTIRTNTTNDEITPYLLDYLKENYPNAKKIAVCGVTDTTTEGMYGWLKGSLSPFPGKGYELVGELEQMAPDTSDFNPPVQRILSSGPDAIFVVVSTPTLFGFVTKSAREQGFSGPVFCATSVGVDFTNTIAGGNASDIFGVGAILTDMDPLSQDLKDARALYAAKGYAAKDEISDVYVMAYNGMWAFLQAIQKANSVDPAEVAKTFATLTNKGDLKTLWGDAFVGGKQSTGVNAVINQPQWITACQNGVSTNAKYVEMVLVP